MGLLTRYYRIPALSESENAMLLHKLQKASCELIDLQTEWCFYIEHTAAFTHEKERNLLWLLRETFEPHHLHCDSFLNQETSSIVSVIWEFGPRLAFSTAWNTNAVAICHNIGLTEITRLERSIRYKLTFKECLEQSKAWLQLSSLLHDRMTHCHYPSPLSSFHMHTQPLPWKFIEILEKGSSALIEFSEDWGLAFDDQDISLYMHIFKEYLKRNPTDVECHDLAQSNSEHSRHWFFNGDMYVDGQKQEETLFQLVKKPLKANTSNSVLAFCDNASAIRGGLQKILAPCAAGFATVSQYIERIVDYDITFTAETHNFPCGVAPFPGAETGAGGRMRDGHAAGRGSLLNAGTAGYCVGCLHILGYTLPWEPTDFEYPQNMALPLQILLEASDGASDYGNKFGEPLINGFTRSFGLRLPNNERREWIKPIMFVGGLGQIDHHHLEKGTAEVGMLIVKLGGPAYRIGMGGGSASSQIAGANDAALDYNAVQRGDAKMLQCVNRVVRACVEMGEANPIVAIHDQGAGGNANVLKELIYPSGGYIDISRISCGDPTMSVLERWGAEYQENDALLIRETERPLFEQLCHREHCPVSFIGHITSDGCIRVYDPVKKGYPVDLPLEKVLGKLPPKTFEDRRIVKVLSPLVFPVGLTLGGALDRVLRLVTVGSKRFLVHKVDRSVTGLVSQQQCCGPLEVPVVDCAVVAHSYFGLTGTATAIGEQPLKGLVDSTKMGRLCVTEALTNLIWAKISHLSHIKASGNWMWAAKMEGEPTEMISAATAMSEFMVALGIAIDGGKDSLSMACHVPQSKEVVKCPGELTISVYADCTDITCTVTPNLQCGRSGKLLYVDLSTAKRGGYSLGGSALAYAFQQVGEECPDVTSAVELTSVWNALQQLIGMKRIAAGHDISDGGLIVTVLEMAFAGNCGVLLDLAIDGESTVLEALFSESPGLVFEVHEKHFEAVLNILHEHNVFAKVIGHGQPENQVTIYYNGNCVLEDTMSHLRDIWESTSYEIEKLQRNVDSVHQEYQRMKYRKVPPHSLMFEYSTTDEAYSQHRPNFRVAILRDEGSNGDREMAAAFHLAGFEAWDVTMSDLLDSRVDLSKFCGLIFVGGFSYGDTLDSAKGWSASIRLNPHVLKQFDDFYNRLDTFSLGVCNGCQLLALLGWIPGKEWCLSEEAQPRFIHNKSGKYESRFVSVKILKSVSIFMDGMEGSTLGVWVAHGEGQAVFPDSQVLPNIQNYGQIPAVYVDDENQATEAYPFNPNGSPNGVVGIASYNGRHLGMMPHPERSVLMWQWPYAHASWKQSAASKGHLSPWIKMFQNVRKWCETNASSMADGMNHVA